MQFAVPEDQRIIANSGTVSKLTKNIKDLAEKRATRQYSSDDYKGDAFEWFAECFFKSFPNDTFELFVTDYTPVTGQEYGIDGLGKYTRDLAMNVAIQVKFRSNIRKLLSAKEDNLANMAAWGVKFDVERDRKYQVVFSNAMGLTTPTEEGIYDGNIRMIGNKIIRRYVDNNEAFWNGFLSACDTK